MLKFRKRDREDKPEDDNKNLENITDEPKETNEPESAQEDNENFGGDLTLYTFVYLLGANCIRVGKRFFKGLRRIIVKPFRAIYSVARIFAIGIDHLFFKWLHRFIDELHYIKAEVKSAYENMRGLSIKNVGLIFSVLRHYIKKGLSRHRAFARSVIRLAMPVAGLIVLVLTINYWNERTFALEILYGNVSLGYVADENVYLDAETLANERLNLGESETASSQQTEVSIEKPTYKIRVVSKNELTDSSALCDALIENSQSNITNACGIYVDGEFLCAVKNETDATSVFDEILEANKPADGEGIVGFVEDIEYVQGLYPDNDETIWDAAKLKAKLATNKTEAVYHTVQDGDTLYDIALEYDTTIEQLYAMNPDMGENIYMGDKIIVSMEVNYVRVKVMKTEVRTEEIPYETVKTESSSLYKGTQRIKTEGVEGLAKVTELVSYVDGVKISTEEIDRVTIREPVDREILVGTKSLTISGGGGSITPTSGRFVWPVIGLHSISRSYGYASSSYASGYHTGIDITGGGAYGRTIVAADAGTVVQAGWNGSYGYCITIQHSGGLRTLYAHCSSVGVYVGQYVYQGQAIGRVGNSGYSFGAHLHFEVHVNGRKVNPNPYLGR